MIRAALYLGLALMLLSAVFPNPFPVLLVGGAVALGALARGEGDAGPDEVEVQVEVERR